MVIRWTISSDLIFTVHFVEGVKPVAVDMLALAEKAFREQNFIDVAYSTPLYLKEFQATKPRNPILDIKG